MTRQWVDDGKPKPIDKRWVLRCDVITGGVQCSTTSTPVERQEQISLAGFAASGWFIAKVFGDICPSCLAAGIEPRGPRYGVRTPLPTSVGGDS